LSERTLHENFTLRIRAVEDEERFRRMLELSPIAACVTDVDTRRVLFANQSYAALSGLSLEQVMRGDPKRFYAQPEEYAAALEKLACGEKVAGKLLELAFSDGPEGKKWVLATYLSTEYRGEPAVLGWLYDITDRKQAEEYVQHLAYHDPLTELPNRMLLRDRLNQALALAECDKSAVVLMFVDLDGFKPVNDAYGHDVGDLLLKAVAKRLRDCVRRSDSVARIGGDEFIILLTTIETTENAMEVAEKIRQSLNESFVLAGHTLHISSSIGVATYPDHARNARELIHCADIAMYYAKAEGRDAVRLYRPGMESGDERPE
jgi:diguanylate cyclase (GGDEF)-like protein/PAS domain S-box-containing protein